MPSNKKMGGSMRKLGIPTEIMHNLIAPTKKETAPSRE